MTFPFQNLLGINYKCLVSSSVSRYIVHVLHRVSLQSARSRCHVKRHLVVLALKRAFRTEIACWKRKYPILFQLCQGQLSVITAVNSLLTSKGCLYMRNVFIELSLALNILLLMVFTVTSSDCKVKKARFYEFLFTLGWRLIGNTSLYKFSAPKHVSFRKYSSLNFRVFTVRDTKIGSYLLEKKSLRLIFSSLTISSIRRYVYAQVC